MRKVVVTRAGVTVDLNLEDVFSFQDMPLGAGAASADVERDDPEPDDPDRAGDGREGR